MLNGFILPTYCFNVPPTRLFEWSQLNLHTYRNVIRESKYVRQKFFLVLHHSCSCSIDGLHFSASLGNLMITYTCHTTSKIMIHGSIITVSAY